MRATLPGGLEDAYLECSYHVMPAIAAVHRLHRYWLFPPLGTHLAQCLPVLGEPVLREETLGSGPAQILQVLCLKDVVSSSIGTYCQPLGGTRTTALACVVWQSLQSSGQQLIRGLFRLGAEGFVRWSMALVG